MTVSFTYVLTFEIGAPKDLTDLTSIKRWTDGAVDSAKEFADAMNEWINKQPLVDGCKMKQTANEPQKPGS